MTELKATITDDLFKEFYTKWDGEYDLSQTTKLTVKSPLNKTLLHQYLYYLDKGIASNKTRFLTILMCYGYDKFIDILPEGLRGIPALKSMNHVGAYESDISTMIAYEKLTMPARVFRLKFGELTNSEIETHKKAYVQVGQVKDLMGDFNDILGFSSRHGHAQHFLMMLALRDCHFVADFPIVKESFEKVLNPTIQAIQRLYEE